jgi:DNA-3-methyladenine glycosylase
MSSRPRGSLRRARRPRGYGRPLPRSFFRRATTVVARDLLGAVFSVRSPDATRYVRIVETEAYVADDPANHANRGMTRRNRSMFGRPGTIYVYRIHQVVCANVVTQPGQAALLRAGEPLGPVPGSTSGPGRFCRSLGITIADDGDDVVLGPRFRLRKGVLPPERIVVGPRVGISRARDRPLRFVVSGSKHVSRPRPTPAGPLSAASPRSSRGGVRYRRTRTRRTRPSADDTSAVRSVGR